MIWHTKKWKVTVCCCFIHRTICWINLFSSDSLNCAASIVRARYSTSQIVLNFPWESYLNQGSKKRLYIYFYIFSKFSYCQRNPLMKNIKTKKKYLYHLCNFNSPLLDKPPPWAGPRVKYCLRCSFWLLAVFRHFPPSSVCPGFCQFRNILMCCAILLQYVAFKANIKHK